jgi:hypothetical protein
LPDGLFCDTSVQPRAQKYSASRFAKISTTTAAVPARHEGRIAIVTNVGRNAMDGSARKTKRAGADGEAVWS